MRTLLLGLTLTLISCSDGTFTPADPQEADRLAAEFSRVSTTTVNPRAFRALASLSHVHLDLVLQAYFSADGLRFAGIQDDPEAQALLADYRLILAQARPESMTNPAERIAFWVNAYTALVVEGLIAIVREQGTDARIDIDDFALFTRTKHRVAGFSVTLEEIEHLVLRGHRLYPDVRDTPVGLADDLMTQHRLLFPTGRRDPRVNFAVSFGARSFPPIPAFAYRADRLEAQLDARTRAFLNDQTHGASDRGVSVLFEWFRRDFVEHSGSVRAFIEPYLDDPNRPIATDRSLRYEWGVQ